MMISVLLTDVRPLLDYDLFRSKLTSVSQTRQRRVLSYRFAKDRALSLGVGLLCDDYLSGHISGHNCREQESGFAYDQLGRPYFSKLPQIHLSLSHSGLIAAAVFSDSSKVGIDVEEIRAVSFEELQISHQYFSKDESDFLGGLSGTEQELEFYRLWTKYESQYKYNSQYDAIGAIGATGAVDAPSTVRFLQLEQLAIDKQLGNYAMSVCANQALDALEPEIITLSTSMNQEPK
jgi:4'-phosphopantetheinyl transferase